MNADISTVTTEVEIKIEFYYTKLFLMNLIIDMLMNLEIFNDDLEDS